MSKYLFFECIYRNAHWSKVYNQSFSIFTKKCNAIFLKTSNFLPQGLQVEALQQRYSPFKSENPNFRGVKGNRFHKHPNFVSKFFSWVIWSLNYWTHLIAFHEKSAPTDFSQEMCVPISKSSNIWALTTVSVGIPYEVLDKLLQTG